MHLIKPTDEQNEVINYNGNIVVVARPGSGKTYILSEIIKSILPKLLNHQGVIAISYTNKASNELMRRSSQNTDVKSSFFGTIDRFCDSEIIIPFISHFWGSSDTRAQICRIKDLPDEEKTQFSVVKENQLRLTDLESILHVLKAYYKKGILFLETNGALAVYVINNSMSCRRFIKSRYTHIIIDEYQDSGIEQNELFLAIKDIGLTAIAVGDADQSIFGFSGKDSKYLLDLSKRDDFKLFPVNYNHRCHASIINYSLRLLNKNVELLKTDEIRIFEKVCTGIQTSIAVWIEEIIDEVKIEFNVTNNKDIGILVRSGKSGELFNNQLTIPHRYFQSTILEEHFSLWAKLFCQLLHFKFNNEITAEEIIDASIVILNRIQKTILRNKIIQIRENEINSLDTLFEDIASIIYPNARSSEALTLLSQILYEESSLECFKPARDDEIQIMTIHKAKGLEFDIVFHADLYEWVLPAAGPGDGNDWNNPVYINFEQDINLHYVGITRAKKACYLCHSTQRVNSNNQIKNGAPSDFLSYNELDTLRKRLL